MRILSESSLNEQTSGKFVTCAQKGQIQMGSTDTSCLGGTVQPPKCLCQPGCTSAQGQTKILFVPEARLTYIFFYFIFLYSFFDSRLGKKWRGHLNFTRCSAPLQHQACDIYLKWIKLPPTAESLCWKSLWMFQLCRFEWVGWLDGKLQIKTSFLGLNVLTERFLLID